MEDSSFGCLQPLPPNNSPDNPRTLGVSPPFPPRVSLRDHTFLAKKQSPKQAFATYLAPLPRTEVRAKPGFPRPSPLSRSQPPSASHWVLHGARQARAVLSSGAPGSVLVLRLQAANARGTARPEAVSLSRWSPRLALLGSFPSAPGSQGLSVGDSNSSVFSARLKNPFSRKCSCQFLFPVAKPPSTQPRIKARRD